MNPYSYSPLQNVALLLLNVPDARRVLVLDCLAGTGPMPEEPHARQVTRACQRILQACESQEYRRHILCYAREMAQLLEHQNVDTDRRHPTARVVGTLPEFLYQARQHDSPPPINHGSLEAEVARIARGACRSLDITIPYVSHSGVDIFTLGLKPRSRRGLQVRVLTLLTSEHTEQNTRGVMRLVERYRTAGAHVEVRSPTDGQAQRTGAIAVMHAKAVIADQQRGYLGTANISKAGLQRGFELGMILGGELAEHLWRLNDWVYQRHQRWEIPRT